MNQNQKKKFNWLVKTMDEIENTLKSGMLYDLSRDRTISLWMALMRQREHWKVLESRALEYLAYHDEVVTVRHNCRKLNNVLLLRNKDEKPVNKTT